MRIFTDPLSAVQEVERDLWEMGINVHPQTMQDRDVHDNPDYMTKELQHYGFNLQQWRHSEVGERAVLDHVLGKDKSEAAQLYVGAEFFDRVSATARNPGTAWQFRSDVWNEFMHGGKFAYTYSERISPQLPRILQELKDRPSTRQAIIDIHSNICPSAKWQTDADNNNLVGISADLQNMGGKSRIPCSLYYQIMRRNSRVDLIYAMRSCDFLVHFPIDIMLALRLQSWFADRLDSEVGMFTYFTGSLHAYAKDMRVRGIF